MVFILSFYSVLYSTASAVGFSLCACRLPASPCVHAESAGIRVIDQSFGVDHNNDLWPAEDEKWDEENLWGRPEDDSKTNTDSEAEDALESLLAFA